MAPDDTARFAFKATWYEWNGGRCHQRTTVVYASEEARAYEKITRTLRADGRGYSGLFVRLEGN